MIDFFAVSNADRLNLALRADALLAAVPGPIIKIIPEPRLNLSNVVVFVAALLFVIEVILNWSH